MAVKNPDIDLRRYLSGGSDSWDNLQASTILLDDYFETASPSTSGQVKVWNGSAFVAKPVKVWDGSVWVIKPLKRWNGTSWIVTPY